MTARGRTLMRIASRILPPERSAWGTAMAAEFDALPRAERLGFALSCVRGAATERTIMLANNPWRVARWTIAGLLLCAPALAMRLGAPGVDWSAGDFIAMGAMLGIALLGYEALTRRSAGFFHRTGAAVAVLGGFLLLWVNLAVGIIGTEANPANWMYAGVLALIVGGAIAARLRPGAMARVMLAAAVAQVLAAGVAVIGRLGGDEPAWPYDTLGATALFTAIWLAAAWLFGRTAAGEAVAARG